MEVSLKSYEYMSWIESSASIDKNDVEKISLLDLPIDDSWKDTFNALESELVTIKDRIINDSKKRISIFPYPDLLFKAFELPIDKVRIVIVGQDPYFGFENYKDEMVPQAMGLSFSVPHGMKIPSSLSNIYNNLVKFGHLKRKPTHGNLERLQSQGVMFLNSALSVMNGKANSHQYLWKKFTSEIIKTLDSEDVTFVLWGANAIGKGLDLKKSKQICSSHPSGFSCHKPCGVYPAFMECDFAKELNVDWNVLLK